jgi:RHS repeat-associated protein
LATGEYQSVSGAVNTSTTPEVQYGYSDPSTGSRQTSMTYPNGRVIDYDYNTGIDNAIGRVSAIADAAGSDAGTLQSYTYQGLSTIVGETDGNGVTETTTLDGFGRTAELAYVNSSGTTTDDFQYGYDRDGNVLYQNNLLNGNFSQLYHANSTSTGDDNTAYDPLNRLAGFEQGTLSASGNNGTTPDTVASANQSQSWNLNTVGDQSSVTTNGNATTNTTNAKNELTTNGPSPLSYDNNGNTLTDENGQTYTYDAWNRQVTAKNSSGATIAAYSCDPTGRRITETSGNTTTDIYFTNQWQDIEERQGGAATRQNVWGEGYVNQLVERDDSSASGNLGITGSGLGERLYAQQDANWSVTGLIDTSGTVVERISYSPYGTATFFTADWLPSSNACNQDILFQGGVFESSTGNYNFQHRDENPQTGTWDEPDPASYINSNDLYEYTDDNPGISTDANGLKLTLINVEPGKEEGTNFSDDDDQISADDKGNPITWQTVLAENSKVIDDIIKKLGPVTLNQWQAALAKGGIKWDGNAVNWSKDKYLQELNREKESKVIKQISGGLDDTITQLKAALASNNESWDMTGVFFHSNVDDPHAIVGLFPDGKVPIAQVYQKIPKGVQIFTCRRGQNGTIVVHAGIQNGYGLVLVSEKVCLVTYFPAKLVKQEEPD